MNSPHLIEKSIQNCAAAIQNFVRSDGADDDAARLDRVKEAFKGSLQWSLNGVHARAFLPLAEAITAWRCRRLPPAGRSPAGRSTNPAAEVLILYIAVQLARNIGGDVRLAQIRDTAAWAPGERLSLLGPMNVFVDYAVHPAGLKSLSFDVRDLPKYQIEDSPFVAHGAPVLLLSIVTGIFQSGAWDELSATGDRELDAAKRTLYVREEAAEGANAAMARLVLPTVLPLLSFNDITNVFDFHDDLIMGMGFTQESKEGRAACEMYIALLASVAQQLAATAGQPAISLQQMTSLWKMGATADSSTDVAPWALEALAAGARWAGRAAPAAAGRDKMILKNACLIFHGVRLRLRAPDALNGATAAFLSLHSVANETDIAGSDYVENDLRLASLTYMRGVTRFVAAKTALDRASGGPRAQAPSTPGPELYTDNLRCLNAVMAAAPRLLPENLPMIAVPLTYFLDAQTACRPDEATGNFPAALLRQAGDLSRAFCTNACKAALASLAGGWPVSITANSSPEETKILMAGMLTHLFSKQLAELCMLLSFEQMAVREADSEDAPVRATAAVVLRGLHLIERLMPVHNAVLGGYLSGSRHFEHLTVPEEVNLSMLLALTSLSDELTPALTSAVVPVLRWLIDPITRIDTSGQDMSAARYGLSTALTATVEAMAKKVEGVDPKDVAAAKARADILAAGGDCAYVGCDASIQAPGADGAATAKMRICSGCRQIRYCSHSSQRADWKSHRIACRAIQAERAD